MKKKIKALNTTETQKRVLRYLDGHGESSSEEIAVFLKKSVPATNTILSDLESPNGVYVKVRYEKEKQFWEITNKGIEYLQRLESHSFEKQQIEIQKEQVRFNRVIAVAGGVIAIVTLLNFLKDGFDVNLVDYPIWVTYGVAFLIVITIAFLGIFIFIEVFRK